MTPAEIKARGGHVWGFKNALFPTAENGVALVPKPRRDSKDAEVKRLQDLLFAKGAMNSAPCFCCGYKGEGYFQTDKHPCAARHHALFNQGTTPC